jgi:hypothetical protein
MARRRARHHGWRRCCSGGPVSGTLLITRSVRPSDDVERAVGFVADIQPAAVGRRGGAVPDLDAGDLPHDLVGGGIDDVTLSPALLVWMIRTAGPASQRRRPAASRRAASHRAPTRERLHSGSLAVVQCFPPS